MAIKIKWNKIALSQFEEAIKYIDKESVMGAVKVRTAILLNIDTLLKYPEKCSPDKYKINNDGSFVHSKYITIESHIDI